ncbi:hypothetical protein COU57_05515 [Candidatus Pacearchaeota archaeon CG10_big_fil_rev_8_21_14_0_10_32_14]|nr:MAG: hypothetical protein COU57_05515 [Candidatus Pacearchaeota archaeon CG10_big_fil_rev_8_21_14_0_10_32_14]
MRKKKKARFMFRDNVPFSYGKNGKQNMKCLVLDELESIEVAKRKTRARLRRLDKGRSIFNLSRYEEQESLVQYWWNEILEGRYDREKIAA